jgi:hypothetical protein
MAGSSWRAASVLDEIGDQRYAARKEGDHGNGAATVVQQAADEIGARELVRRLALHVSLARSHDGKEVFESVAPALQFVTERTQFAFAPSAADPSRQATQ